MTDAAVGTDAPVLAVPATVELPEAARARLERQYDRHRPALGIVAAVGHLHPGSSVTTTAERAAMAPADAVATTDELEVTGAVLLAPGVAHTVGERTVRIEAPDGATLLVDEGAAAFDRDAPAPAPEPPGEDARPPFRWRPLVLLLAGRPDDARAAMASGLADALLDHDVEPRVAVPSALAAPMRTAPLPPDGATVNALRPDVVVALDADAVELAERHAASRSMVVVLVDDDLGERIELVSWNLDHAPGRLRARIGERVDPAAFAALVNRLCAGPQPEPPTDTTGPDDAIEPTATAVALGSLDDTPPPPPTPRLMVIDPSSDGEGGPRPLLAGLVDHLLASGWVLAGPDAAVQGAPVDLVLVGGAAPTVPVGSSAAGDVVRVVEVDHDADVEALVHEASTTGGVDELTICGSVAIAARLRSAGIPTIAVPRLRTRAELAALAAAHDGRIRPAVPTVAVVLGDDGDPPADVLRSVAAALDHASEVAGGVAVVVVGPPGSAAPPVATSTPVTARTELGDVADVAGWSAALWLADHDEPTGPPGVRRSELDAAGDEPLVTLALAGVPVLMPAAATAGRSPLPDRTLTVERPDEVDGWTTVLTALLDDDRRAVASDRARRVAVAAHGEDGAALVVQRVCSWLGTGTR